MAARTRRRAIWGGAPEAHRQGFSAWSKGDDDCRGRGSFGSDCLHTFDSTTAGCSTSCVSVSTSGSLSPFKQVCSRFAEDAIVKPAEAFGKAADAAVGLDRSPRCDSQEGIPGFDDEPLVITLDLVQGGSPSSAASWRSRSPSPSPRDDSPSHSPGTRWPASAWPTSPGDGRCTPSRSRASSTSSMDESSYRRRSIKDMTLAELMTPTEFARSGPGRWEPPASGLCGPGVQQADVEEALAMCLLPTPELHGAPSPKASWDFKLDSMPVLQRKFMDRMEEAASEMPPLKAQRTSDPKAVLEEAQASSDPKALNEEEPRTPIRRALHEEEPTTPIRRALHEEVTLDFSPMTDASDYDVHILSSMSNASVPFHFREVLSPLFSPYAAH
eukprot:TRINITY_DN7555_c0_g1_i1.p1 TRINITY_DN7555_c0_g1~~TRINITY_DN7555_c0_g1_i1.p1  ORF type:complete len:385 (+),score=69.88 TRINITY_DN7555_c0_g1_i1:44-1198(+)